MAGADGIVHAATADSDSDVASTVASGSVGSVVSVAPFPHVPCPPCHSRALLSRWAVAETLLAVDAVGRAVAETGAEQVPVLESGGATTAGSTVAGQAADTASGAAGPGRDIVLVRHRFRRRDVAVRARDSTLCGRARHDPRCTPATARHTSAPTADCRVAFALSRRVRAQMSSTCGARPGYWRS